jgi:hypothetical protein
MNTDLKISIQGQCDQTLSVPDRLLEEFIADLLKDARVTDVKTS